MISNDALPHALYQNGFLPMSLFVQNGYRLKYSKVNDSLFITLAVPGASLRDATGTCNVQFDDPFL